MLDVAWQAEYNTEAGFAVLENLIFEGDLSFSQTLVASGAGACTDNSVNWSGDYHLVDGTTMVISYIRCTPSGPGCLTCGATREELTRFKFANDCQTLTTVAIDSETARDYVSIPRR